MKFPVWLGGILALVICLSVMGQTNSATDQTLLTALGWQFAQGQNLNGVDINDDELANFLNGFSLGVQNRQLPFPHDDIFSDVSALAKIRQKRVMDAIADRNLVAAEHFLDRWKAGAQVTSLPDGVGYQILNAGEGAPGRPTQTVNVHYIARLINGDLVTEFGPDDIILVTNHLNVGLFEGFQKIGKGGKMQLYLPPDLAADQIEIASAPHGSALVYEIEMFSVKDTSTNDLSDALVLPAPDPPPPDYSGKFPTNEVIEAWGWNLARSGQLWKLGLSDGEITSLRAGLEAGVRQQALSFDAKTMQPQIDRFINKRNEEFQETAKQKQIDAMNTLFAQLDEDTNVVKLPDGLRYVILKPGNDHFPRTGQIVLVNYTGRTLGGHVFDQTVNEPLHVEVGKVMPGWSEGIQKIGIGGKIKLYIPPSLGYGNNAVSGIPAYSTLIYDIELLDIQQVQ